MMVLMISVSYVKRCLRNTRPINELRYHEKLVNRQVSRPEHNNDPVFVCRLSCFKHAFALDAAIGASRNLNTCTIRARDLFVWVWQRSS